MSRAAPLISGVANDWFGQERADPGTKASGREGGIADLRQRRSERLKRAETGRCLNCALVNGVSGVIERAAIAARARARRHAMDALNERTARFPPGIDTALDVISGAESGVLCGLHRHCGAFTVGAVEQQDLARDRGEHTQHTAR